MSKLHSDALKLDGKGYGYNRKAIVKRYFSYLMVITLLASSSYLQAATPTNKKTATKPTAIKPITDVKTNVQRDWLSDDGQFLLTLYSGVWNPHGTLFYLKQRGGVSVEGFQKGLDITLKSYDPEVGLEAPPEYAIAGTLNLRNNTMTGTVTHYPENKDKISTRKTKFTPAIAIKGAYPQFVFKHYGVEDPDWHRWTITKVEVINRDSKALVQTLSGFNAQSYSTNYDDMNYDGYLDLVLDVGEGLHDDNYVYWLYEPKTKKFVRNKTLEAIKGYPTRYPHKRQLHLNKDALLERVNGQWQTMPCCYAD